MNKKGFTLIELLAVIVILAIIAIIATPIVLSIINDSRESAGLRSAEMYLDAVEQSVSIEKMNSINFKPSKCLVKNGNFKCDETNLKVEVKGEVPQSGTITFENGKINDVELTYKNEKTIVKNSEGNLAYGKPKVWTLTKAEGNIGETAEIGDILTIKTENFYVYSNEDGYIKAIAKYNLFVGGYVSGKYSEIWTPYDTSLEGYGLQHTEKYGYGVTAFSSSNQSGLNYSDYVGSKVEVYVKEYKTKLESMGATFIDNLDDLEDPDDQLAGSGVRLITKKELEKFGCSSNSSCSGAPTFITEISYWSSSAHNSANVGAFNSYGYFGNYGCLSAYFGVRPVIILKL